jgi:hypothetical protein
MRLPRWAWVIAGLAVSIIVLVSILERVFPESDEIEDIGRTNIARATSRVVTTIQCERTPHIRSDIDLPCKVTLDDGTTFDTVAHVDAHYRYANHYSFSATFSPLPGHAHPKPDPPHTSKVRTPEEADRLGACVQAAGTDPAKIRACAARM